MAPVLSSIWRGESSPLCVTRVGPRRAASAPFRKSNTSLAKFEPIWSRSATASVSAQSSTSKRPRVHASALPTSTDTIEAASVRGRAANSHAFQKGINADIGEIVTWFCAAE